MMSRPRSNVANLRREQIIEAATGVIAEQGIQALSLSAIEQRAGMVRGQLTYYFKTKEDILLAVFDRLLRRMHQRMLEAVERGHFVCPESGWEWVRVIMEMVLTQPPPDPEFGCLQYTFLAQVGHREDFRHRLATLYESWRSNMALGLAQDQARGLLARRASPRALATLVQALLHGLVMQAVADPNAFDPQELLHLCLDMLGTYLGLKGGPSQRRQEGIKTKTVTRRSSRANGAAGPALKR
jgi:AcrR family transcriptional regulator